MVKNASKVNQRKGAKPQGRKECCIAPFKFSCAEAPAFSSHEPLVQQPAGLLTMERYVAIVSSIKYASLREMHKMQGIAEYKLAQSLPDDLKGSLPIIEELEKELGELKEVEDDE